MKNKSILILKELKKSMITKSYVNWINNYKTMMFTEQRFTKHTFKDVENFVKTVQKSEDEFLYGIFLKHSKKKVHIENIKLGPINFYHKYSYISYFIGNKDYLNKGYGKLLIGEILKVAKKKFKLNKVLAGVYSNNISSIKILEFNKFKLEGKIKKQFRFGHKYIDHLIFGKLL